MTMTTDTIVPLPARKRLAVSSLFARSVADRMGLTLWIGVGVGLMSLMVAAMYSSLEETLLDFDLGGAMEAFLFGSDIASPVGWITAEMYSMVVPMAIVALAVIDGGRSFAGEEEDRSIGLLAANPISRTRIIADKVAGMAVHVVVASILMGFLLWVGVAAFSLDMSKVTILRRARTNITSSRSSEAPRAAVWPRIVRMPRTAKTAESDQRIRSTFLVEPQRKRRIW